MNRGLTTFFFVLSFISINTFSQKDDVLEKKISFRAKHKPLHEVLSELSKQSDISLSYSHDQIPVHTPISINIRNKPLKTILQEILMPLRLEFVLIENQIIIRPSKITATPEPSQAKDIPPKIATLKGHVTDAKTGESLPGVSIYTSDIQHGTTTNGYGFYSLSLQQGKYQIVFSFIGYESITREIHLTQSNTLNIQLEFQEFALEPIIITSGEEQTAIIKKNNIGIEQINPKKISEMPVFFAETDVLKSLTYIQGVKNTIDGSSNFIVRGGLTDQNLILLDDAPLYNPSHFFGFFTSVNPYALKDIQFYKSDFPAYHGGKLSSILELRTNDGNMNAFSMSGDMGFLTSRLALEGPISKNIASYYISYRTSHVEKLIQRTFPALTDMKFTDFHAKMNCIVNTKNRLYLSFYSGGDKLLKTKNTNDKDGIVWGNFLASLRWNYIWNNKLFSNTTLYLSRYDYFLYVSQSTNTGWNSGIGTIGLKQDYTYFKNPKNTSHFGIQISAFEYNPGVLSSDYDVSNNPYSLIKPLHTIENNLYYSSNHIVNERNIIRYGMRLTFFNNIGPAVWYSYNQDNSIADTNDVQTNSSYNTYVRLAPSVTYTHILNSTNSLKFNYFRAYQFHQILSNTVSPFTTMEIWYPSTPNIKPQSVDQFTIGYTSSLFRSSLLFSLEGYFKHYRKQYDYINQPQLIFNPHIERELIFGNSNVLGYEISLKQNIGNLTAFAGFAYCRAIRTNENAISKETYPLYSDKPFDISAHIQYQKNRWLFSAGFIYTSGLPFTSPTAYFDYQGYKVPVYSAKNNSRMPDYSRTDVSARVRLNKHTEKKFHHFLTFSIYNLLNNQNPAFVHFNKIQNESGNFVTPVNLANEYSLVPTQVILIGIIPSIKYNFYF